MKIIIFNNGHTLASHSALLAFGESLTGAGHTVRYLNPNGFTGDQLEPGDAAVVYGRGEKQEQVKEAYQKAKIPVKDVSERLLRYSLSQILGGALIAEFFPETAPAETPGPPASAPAVTVTPARGRPKGKK